LIQDVKDNGNEDLRDSPETISTNKLIDQLKYLSNVTKVEVRFNS